MLLLPLLVTVMAPGEATVTVVRGIAISADTRTDVPGARRRERIDGDTRLILVEFE